MHRKGKITEKEITELKRAWPGAPLFKFSLPLAQNDEFVCRTISTKTAGKIAVLRDDAARNNKPIPVDDINRKLYDECVLWPSLTLEEIEGLPVGVIPSLCKIIQERSGYVSVDIHGRILAPDFISTAVNPFPGWGDISKEELENAIKEFPFSLYRVKLEHLVFLIRPMTRTDLRISIQAVDDQIALVKSITVWPKEVDWENMPAGWIENIGKIATDISGWEANVSVEEI